MAATTPPTKALGPLQYISLRVLAIHGVVVSLTSWSIEMLSKVVDAGDGGVGESEWQRTGGED